MQGNNVTKVHIVKMLKTHNLHGPCISSGGCMFIFSQLRH